MTDAAFNEADLDPEPALQQLDAPPRLRIIVYECETCAHEWNSPGEATSCPVCFLTTIIPRDGAINYEEQELDERKSAQEEMFNRIDRFLDKRFTHYTKMAPQSSGIDNMKWGKMLKEMRFTDPDIRVDPIRGDIIFTRNKSKGGRQLTFIEFGFAMEELAAHLLPDYGADSLAALAQITKPCKKPTVPKTNSIFSRLTDHTLYTGSHKHRFDKNGNGRGRFGRMNLGDDPLLKKSLRKMSRSPSKQDYTSPLKGGTSPRPASRQSEAQVPPLSPRMSPKLSPQRQSAQAQYY
jgi:hypothetical protein